MGKGKRTRKEAEIDNETDEISRATMAKRARRLTRGSVEHDTNNNHAESSDIIISEEVEVDDDVSMDTEDANHNKKKSNKKVASNKASTKRKSVQGSVENLDEQRGCTENTNNALPSGGHVVDEEKEAQNDDKADELYVSIRELDPWSESSTNTLVARVVIKGDIMTLQHVAMLKLLLADGNGNESMIEYVLRDNLAMEFASKIQENKCYAFSGFAVQQSGPYNKTAHSFELGSIGNTALVRPAPKKKTEGIAKLPVPSLSTFKAMKSMVNKDVVSFIGMIVAVDEVQKANTSTSSERRVVYLMDESDVIKMTAWKEMTKLFTEESVGKVIVCYFMPLNVYNEAVSINCWEPRFKIVNSYSGEQSDMKSFFVWKNATAEEEIRHRLGVFTDTAYNKIDYSKVERTAFDQVVVNVRSGVGTAYVFEACIKEFVGVNFQTEEWYTAAVGGQTNIKLKHNGLNQWQNPKTKTMYGANQVKKVFSFNVMLQESATIFNSRRMAVRFFDEAGQALLGMNAEKAAKLKRTNMKAYKEKLDKVKDKYFLFNARVARSTKGDKQYANLVVESVIELEQVRDQEEELFDY